MIDYLEELLEEEAAVDLEGNLLTVVGHRRGAPPTGEEEAGEEDDPDRLSPGAAQAGQKARLPAVEEDTAEGESASLEAAAAAPAGERTWAAAQARETGAAGLVWQLRQASRAARLALPGQASVTVTLPGGESAPGRLDLLELDRAVQRDARRYDGGFPLY